MPRKPISWPLNAASRMPQRDNRAPVGPPQAQASSLQPARLGRQPFRFRARNLHCRWTEWGAKRRRVKEEEAGPAPPGEDDDALVPAAARACKRTTQLPARLDKRKRLGLDESNVGIAAEQAERTANALGIGKRRIEERHALDASPCNPDMA
jgi:hypothetical protein